MKLNTITGKLDNLNTDALVFFVFKNEDNIELNTIDQKLNGIISRNIKNKYFDAEFNEIISLDTHEKLTAHKIILVGLGSKKKFSQEILRKALSKAVLFCRNHGIKNLTLIINNDEKTISDIAETTFLALYKFNCYKKHSEGIKEIKNINFYILDKKNVSKFEKILKKASFLGETINWTRDLINHPSNHITPKTLAKYAKGIKGGIKVDVLGSREIKKMKMGLLLGVSKGSSEEPQLIVLDYKPKGINQKLETIVLVGKGLTFDSGGISLKPSEKMEEMKMDMAGAGTVIGIMKIISELKPKLRVVGIIPAAENLPSGNAIKPGDILTSMSGKTVEVINTDAEGRLVMADALTFAQKYNPDAIIDLATLTGSCMHALGHEAAGLLGNNDKLLNKIKKSADITGERVWQFPLWDEYRDQIKGEIADLNNTGEERYAGVITASAFLENFIGNIPWAHLDIAGTAMISKSKYYNPKGATGYGVKLLIDLIENWNE
jgi:leucyl aminopeptidase